MNSLQAKQMLKQVDCHGIPRGYNGGYSELYRYCLESIDKLEKIEQIVNKWNNDASHSFEDMCKINGILKE